MKFESVHKGFRHFDITYHLKEEMPIMRHEMAQIKFHSISQLDMKAKIGQGRGVTLYTLETNTIAIVIERISYISLKDSDIKMLVGGNSFSSVAFESRPSTNPPKCQHLHQRLP